MRVYITNERTVKAKNGSEYIVYDGISAKDGRALTIWNKGDEGLGRINLPNKEDLNEALATVFPLADVEFNEQGRSESIELVEA